MLCFSITTYFFDFPTIVHAAHRIQVERRTYLNKNRPFRATRDDFCDDFEAKLCEFDNRSLYAVIESRGEMVHFGDTSER